MDTLTTTDPSSIEQAYTVLYSDLSSEPPSGVTEEWILALDDVGAVAVALSTFLGAHPDRKPEDFCVIAVYEGHQRNLLLIDHRASPRIEAEIDYSQAEDAISDRLEGNYLANWSGFIPRSNDRDGWICPVVNGEKTVEEAAEEFMTWCRTADDWEDF